MRARILIPAVAVALALALPGAAPAATQTAHRGTVTATFTFQGHVPDFKNLHLKIANAGKVLYNAPVSSRLCPRPCWPGATTPHQSSVRVLDLDANGQQDVVLGLYTGGAHCCFVDQVYNLNPATMRYVKTEHYFGNAGTAIKDLGHDGRFEFVSTDDAFYYQFTSFADSGAPVQIWTFANNRFSDVTRSYPNLIRADAAVWWRVFTHHLSDGEGFIAAWAADQDLLGHSTQVTNTLARQLKLGHLHGTFGAPSGKRFVAALQRFLHKRGYV